MHRHTLQSPGRRRRPLGVLLALTVLAATTLARADADPHALLARMNQALAALDYDGVATYTQGDDLAVVRVTHVREGGEVRERLVHLNGARREIRRSGDRVECVMRRGDEILQLARSIPAGPFVRTFTPSLQQVPEHYRLTVGRMNRVADRPASELLIRPRSDDRYGYRIWLDDETGLLLRYELLDTRSNRRIEIFQFTEIDIGEAVAPIRFEAVSGEDMVVQELMLAETRTGSEDSDTGGWQPEWLPQGFEVAARDRRMVPRSLRAVSTRVYSDGLASFSVFVEPVSHARQIQDLSQRRGGTVAVIRTLQGAAGAALVTVVGEIPPQTAERVASRIRASQ